MANMEETNTVENSMEGLQLPAPAMLYRLLWLVLDEHRDLLPLHVDSRNMRKCVQFVDEFPHSRKGGNNPHPAVNPMKKSLLLALAVAAIASLVGAYVYTEAKGPK
jgi:hypothetical protein